MHTHIALFYFIAKKSLGPFFPALPLLMHVPYSVTSLLHSWPCNMLATPAWAMAIPFRESSFVMLVPLRILPASLVYAYQHLLRCGTAVPTLHTMPISHFHLVFAVALGFKLMCWFRLFFSGFIAWRLLPLHSHGGLGPPSSYPWQFSRLFLRKGDHALINCVFFSFVLFCI